MKSTLDRTVAALHTDELVKRNDTSVLDGDTRLHDTALARAIRRWVARGTSMSEQLGHPRRRRCAAGRESASQNTCLAHRDSLVRANAVKILLLLFCRRHFFVCANQTIADTRASLFIKQSRGTELDARGTSWRKTWRGDMCGVRRGMLHTRRMCWKHSLHTRNAGCIKVTQWHLH
jgi:hypothetical protein